MKNPYEVLGVSQNATEEQIKAAYKELVKKYHPDKYINNPLANLAEEKMKEINEAYAEIQKKRSGGYSAGSYGSSSSSRSSSNTGGSYNSYQNYQGAESAKYLHVRSYINSRRFTDAQAVLSAIKDRDAEWYYLSAVTLSNLGWHDKAYQHIVTAVNMDPSNTEYKNAMNKMNYSNKMYREFSQTRGYSSSSPGLCQICTCLCCGDTCCECMGGDLISCC